MLHLAGEIANLFTERLHDDAMEGKEEMNLVVYTYREYIANN